VILDKRRKALLARRLLLRLDPEGVVRLGSEVNEPTARGLPEVKHAARVESLDGLESGS
jgi:hypothetical protein